MGYQIISQISFLQFRGYTGWPRKNGMGYIHNIMQQLVSVYEATSPETNDTKISNFGSVVCFLGHTLWGIVEAQNVSFSA